MSKIDLKLFSSKKYLKISYSFIIYYCILLAFILWFFIYYPEPLYYGISGKDLQSDVPEMVIDNPLLFLLILMGSNLLLIFLFDYLLFTKIGFKLLNKYNLRKNNLQKLDENNRKPSILLYKYRFLMAFSFGPLLFLVPLITFWIFFFEKLNFTKPLYPLIDLNPQNAIILTLIFILYLWKILIEFRINKVFFKTNNYHSFLPCIIKIALLAILLFVPFALNDIIFKTFVTV
ncbi:MAG: hypothetical protein ACP6IY_00600 [Promethearchaeia archaeon]